LIRRVVCPGSFDPIHNGHLDIIGRASQLFDEVVIAVGVNAGKNGLFTAEERMDLILKTTAEYGNVRVEAIDGLLVDFCTRHGIAGSDLDVVLRAGDVDHLVLTGVATSGVVLSTVRQAADLDFGLTVLADACLDSDPEVHRVLTEKVFPQQADVMSAAEWSASLGK
jgi:cytidyltransferase-like protein